MDTGCKFFGEKRVNGAVSLYATFPLKRCAFNLDRKMGLPAWPRARMSRMTMGIICHQEM